MKNPNSYGGVSKLSGKRRRPYWVRLTTGWQTDLETGKVKQLTKTLGYYATRKEAMIALAAYHQNPIDLTKKDITFAEVWEIISPKYFEEHPKSSKALLPVYKRCEPLYNMVMCDLRTKHLQDVVDGMKGMSSQTKLRTVYKMIFKYCLENDILTKDYTAFVKFENNKADIKDKFFTKAEIVKVISAHDQSVASDGILLLLYTGMRIGELLEVKSEDINFEERIIHVRGTKTKNADRLVPIHKDILPIVERRLGGWFERMNYQSFLKLHYTKFLANLGIKHTPHALRHTFVSIADSHDVNQIALKRIVGHANATMTDHYTHKDRTDLLNLIDCLDFVTYLSLTDIKL